MNTAVSENTSFDERGEFMVAARLEYLQDEKGIYGLSIQDLAYGEARPLTYILRPDCLDKTSQDIASRSSHVIGAALQTLPRRVFWRSHHMERQLTAALADAIHARSGFVGNSRRGGHEWWADNKADH